MRSTMRHWIHRTLAATALLLGAPAFATDGDWSVQLSAGAQATDVDGERDGKFEQYRDVPEGLVLELFRLRFDDPESPWDLLVEGGDVGQKDGEARLDFARHGRIRGSVLYDRLRHTSSTGATSLFARRNGRLEVDPAARAALEANPGDARAVIDRFGRPIDLTLQRDTLALDVDLRIADGVDLGLFARTVSREGDQRMGTGTYIRRQAVGPGTGPGFFFREQVEVRGAELPAHVDTKTDDFGFDLDLGRGRVYAVLAWEESSFGNDASVLAWDNPFELPPGASSSASGVDAGADQEPAAPIGSTGNRGRFDRAALDLAPDNDYERFNLSAGVDLPRRTRVHLGYSRAEVTQDDPFLAMTENAAVIFGNGADGVAGTADDVKGPDAPLPAASLDGKVETTRLDVRITSRPLDQLSLRGTYRDYEYDDQRPTLLFPGYSAAGDSYIRRGIGQRDANGNRILHNVVGGYERSTWSVGGAWRFHRGASLDVEYRDTDWTYDHRQVESTSEAAYSAKLALPIGERFAARLSWLDAAREFSGGYAVGLETSRLHAFDVWDRDRTRYGVELDYQASERWTFGLVWSRWKDDFPGVVPGVSAANPFPSQPYGLDESRWDSLALDASFQGDRTRWSFAVGSDESEWTSRAVAKTTLLSDAVQFDPANAWTRSQDDDVRWATLGLDADLVPEKLTLVANVSWYDYDGATDTVNLATPTINSGVAYSFPQASSDLFSGDLRLNWSLKEHLGVYVGYLYEPYRIDDYAWDALQPWMQGVVLETGASPTELRSANAARYLFLDARYSDSTAHVVSVGITLSR